MSGHYTPTAAAALVGTSVSSLRNWCKEFADQLSDGAAPPPGTERRLTPQDVAILQRVKDLRAQGMATDDIKTTLQTEDTTALQPYIDTQVNTPTVQPTTPTEPLQTTALSLQGASHHQ